MRVEHCRGNTAVITTKTISTARKGKIWSKEKVNQLISLYKDNECLWNYYTESYKNKVKRTKAIENICNLLSITKFDFGKKIHNLRNQYNSEMKKLEKRIEEAGGNANNSMELKCRWEHFESLQFLKQVIEPRPGWNSSYIVTQTPPKKMRIKYDYNSDEESEQFIGRLEGTATNTTTVEPEDVAEYFEETTNDDGSIENYEEVVEENTICAKNENSSEKVQEISISFPVTTKPKNFSSSNQGNTSANYIQNLKEEQTSQIFNTVIDTPASTSNPSFNNTEIQNTRPFRDHWEAFGDLVASEFRNLKHETSRKILKRKIMQAMLDVGEDDDNL